jgi:threonine dehydrogenase-like Zn-dependent dehydrogenase
MTKESKKPTELEPKGTGLEMRLFKIAVRWISEVERRDFYPKLVEFCASVLQSEVCALYVRTNQIRDGKPRVCLVAGKLPPNHPKGSRMNPKEVGTEPEQHSYIISEKNSKKFDGITGYIASTGRHKRVTGYTSISKEVGHMGKWDTYVWQGNPQEKFKCMLGVPIENKEHNIIGVIKVENKFSGEYSQDDVVLLKEIGAAISESLEELIKTKKELHPELEEFEYRVPRSKPETFEINKTGEVSIKHSMTAICHSDIYYFKHNKDRKKLDERLPLVLGHETTGEVYQVVGEHKYHNGEIVCQKDKVVVIPLIPCKTCEICKGSYGENYCPSSKFMASNAPGSLRSIYKYYPGLILKISNSHFEKYALFTEPMSNIVQMLDELGFRDGKNNIILNMAPFATQEFTYFHVGKNSFSNIFNSITSEEPFPRTLYVLTNPKNTNIGSYKIKHSNLMIKGLGLLGNPKLSVEGLSTKKEFNNPKILILGSGIMSYLLAMLLNIVYKYPKDMVVVTGRRSLRLANFEPIATRFTIGAYLTKEGFYDYNKAIVDDIVNAGRSGKYDIVFECVGDPAVEQNIELAMKVLNEGGVIAMEGLTEQEIEIDFKAVLEKNIFIKGFYRGSINSYQKSLRFIEEYKDIRENLERLINKDSDNKTINGFHKVSSTLELESVFHKAENKDSFGRIVINDIDLPSEYY